MAVIQNILNLVECGLAATLGTGTKGCKPFFKKVYSMWLTPQGFTYDKSRTLDATYINELKAEGKLIVLKGIRTFTDNTPDDDVETLEDGTEDVVKLGLYKFKSTTKVEYPATKFLFANATAKLVQPSPEFAEQTAIARYGFCNN